MILNFRRQVAARFFTFLHEWNCASLKQFCLAPDARTQSLHVSLSQSTCFQLVTHRFSGILNVAIGSCDEQPSSPAHEFQSIPTRHDSFRSQCDFVSATVLFGTQANPLKIPQNTHKPATIRCAIIGQLHRRSLMQPKRWKLNLQRTLNVDGFSSDLQAYLRLKR